MALFFVRRLTCYHYRSALPSALYSQHSTLRTVRHTTKGASTRFDGDIIKVQSAMMGTHRMDKQVHFSFIETHCANVSAYEHGAFLHTTWGCRCATGYSKSRYCALHKYCVSTVFMLIKTMPKLENTNVAEVPQMTELWKVCSPHYQCLTTMPLYFAQ